MARKSKKLFTIGYEQTPPKAVLDELEQAGVKLVVDVRAVTSSRRPGFSKKQLSAGLDERGIAYVHLAALGTPKEGRLAARSGPYDVLEDAGPAHVKPLPDRELQLAIPDGIEIGEQCGGRDRRAAGGGVLGEAAGAAHEHARLALARRLGRRHVARVEPHRAGAVARQD